MRTTAASAPPSPNASSPVLRSATGVSAPVRAPGSARPHPILLSSWLLARRVVLLEEPRLVGEHDRLYAVAQVELLKDMRDVGLDGGLADVELVPDLRVR